MVVTCENCSARYKLDDNRISGRGAKITCPRCRHVFVVYKDRAASEAQGRVAVGGGVMTPPSASSEVLTPPAEAASETASEAGESAEVAVDKLDFRKVGIQAWKVKVKIGLVYDFSDYRTLARYIAEGRVTSSDKLSHNGSDWTEISEIPDLAAHFVLVYQQLEAEQAAAESAEDEEEDYEDDEPTNIMGMGDGAFSESAAKAVSLTSFSSSAAPRILPSSSGGGNGAELQSAMSAALDAEEEPKAPAPTGPRFIDPFEKRKAQGRRPRPQAGAGATGGKTKARSRPASSSSSRSTSSQGGSGGWMFGLLALALVGVGGWYYVQSLKEATAPVATVTPSAAPSTAPASREEIVAAITKDLAATEPEETEEDAAAEEEDAWGGEEPELIPVGPRGPTRSSVSKQPSAASAAPASRSARDYAAEGDSALQRRDYRTAAAAYRKAVSMEPSNSYYNGRLGNALYRSGDADAAMGPLNSAAGGGYSRAFVDLGDIAAQRGDAAGAIGYYQSYLATSPRDAQAVQAKIDRLSGS